MLNIYLQREFKTTINDVKNKKINWKKFVKFSKSFFGEDGLKKRYGNITDWRPAYKQLASTCNFTIQWKG